MPERVISNAQLILPDEVVTGSLKIDGPDIAAVDGGASAVAAAEDWQGDYLLPGLVELHTDNLEKHLEPRPGVRWPAMPALLTHDAQVSTAGITTVLDAMGIGDFDERSVRAQGLASTVDALRHAREHRLLRAEHLLHLRCEIACDNVVDITTQYLEDPHVRLVSLMDHTPGQRQWVNVEQFRVYTQRNQKWSDDHLAQVVADRLDMQQRNAVRNRRALLELCAVRNLALASHDDTTEAHVQEAAAAGMRISEFPTTEVAAHTARQLGLAIVMGAPNMVRGGSHSGNISTKTLAAAGLLDCLSSDYIPHALLHAAFMLYSEAGWTLARAVAAVSKEPARLVGLTDRGELAAGKRADYVRARLSHGVPVVIGTWRAGERVA